MKGFFSRIKVFTLIILSGAVGFSMPVLLSTPVDQIFDLQAQGHLFIPLSTWHIVRKEELKDLELLFTVGLRL